MGWPTREETIRLMGIDDTQSQNGSQLRHMLSTLRQQRESNPDENGRRTGFYYASLQMYEYTFHTITEPFYDRRRKCLWYLGWRVSNPRQLRVASNSARAQKSQNFPTWTYETYTILCKKVATFACTLTESDARNPLRNTIC